MKIIFALTLLLSTKAFAFDVTFKNQGKLIKKIALKEFSKFEKLQEITVKDPNEGASITYKAYPAKEILNHVYGAEWMKNKEVLFTCLDGYKPTVPMAQFNNATAFFAVERVGARKFSITKSADKKKVNVGPLYLVWRGNDQGVFWPYQLKSIDLW